MLCILHDTLNIYFYKDISFIIVDYMYCKSCNDFFHKLLVYFDGPNYYFKKLENSYRLSINYNKLSYKLTIIYEFHNLYGFQYRSYTCSLKKFIKILNHNYDPNIIRKIKKINHVQNEEEYKSDNFTKLSNQMYNELFKKLN